MKNALADQLRRAKQEAFVAGQSDGVQTTIYGDDYYINNDGELVSACDDCPHNSANWEDEDE